MPSFPYCFTLPPTGGNLILFSSNATSSDTSSSSSSLRLSTNSHIHPFHVDWSASCFVIPDYILTNFGYILDDSIRGVEKFI